MHGCRAIYWSIGNLQGLSLIKMDSTSKSFSARGGGFWAPPTSMLGFWLAWSCADLVLIVKTAVRSRCDSLVMLDDHCFLVLPFNLWLLQPFRPIFCVCMTQLSHLGPSVPHSLVFCTSKHTKMKKNIFVTPEDYMSFKTQWYKTKLDQNTAFFTCNMLPVVTFILQ